MPLKDNVQTLISLYWTHTRLTKPPTNNEAKKYISDEPFIEFCKVTEIDFVQDDFLLVLERKPSYQKNMYLCIYESKFHMQSEYVVRSIIVLLFVWTP